MSSPTESVLILQLASKFNHLLDFVCFTPTFSGGIELWIVNFYFMFNSKFIHQSSTALSEKV